MVKKPIRRLVTTYVESPSLADCFKELFDGGVCMYAHMHESLTKDDVVLFDGGTDVNPAMYDESPHPFSQTPDLKRDVFERMAFRRAQSVGASCLGICRGAQFLTVVSGGKLIQHVTSHGMRSHVIVASDAQIMMAASDHHQMMFPYTTNHELLAWGRQNGESFCEYGKQVEDGKEPEVVWYPDTRSLAIQPHPEWMLADSDFVKYCKELVTLNLFNGIPF